MDRNTQKIINDTYRCDHCNNRPTKKQVDDDPVYLLHDVVVYHKPDLMLCLNCSNKFRNYMYIDGHRWRLFDPDDYDKIKRYDRNKRVYREKVQCKGCAKWMGISDSINHKCKKSKLI